MWALVVAMVATGAYFIFSRHMVNKLDGTGSINSPQAGGTTAPAGQYSSEHVGISFTYPDKYEVESHHEGEGHVLVLLPKGYVPPENGEGPPTITIAEIPVAAGTDLKQWVMSDKRSNWNLAYPAYAGGNFDPETVDSEPAIAFNYSGLYTAKAVVVLRQNKIYAFSVSWITNEDQIRQDFENVLDAVRFIDHAN